MNQKIIRATALGSQAHQILQTLRCAAVAGTSSRGVFVQHVWSPTLFLTSEPYRGPLTINVSAKTDIFRALQAGDRVVINPECLGFPERGLEIDLRSPLIWKPGPAPKQKPFQSRQVQGLISRAKGLQPENAYINLLDLVLPGSKPDPANNGGIAQVIQPILGALSVPDYGSLYEAIQVLIGSGPGLTPLGDDLILGVLLAHHRTYSHLHWSGYEEFCRMLAAAAAAGTTAVSQSLLHCALEGSADERLIRVLDALLAGREISDQNLDSLLCWGSSSGAAVLAGMLLALSALEGFKTFKRF